MGVGRLDVWIADLADPCKISNNDWRVTVTDCKNQVIQWCDNDYFAVLARCGHVELELPPGCYMVTGTLILPTFPLPQPPSPPPFPWIIYRTHVGILTLGCDERACVRLFAATYRRGWRDILLATHLLARQDALPQDVADQVARAMDAALQNAPRTEADAEFEKLEERLQSIAQQ
jgi:hypothetical protein